MDEEEERDPVSLVLGDAPLLATHLAPFLPLADRHYFSTANRTLYYTFGAMDRSLNMMRGLWGAWYVRPEERITILAKSGVLECFEYAWNKPIAPLRLPPLVIHVKDLIRSAALTGSKPVIKFLLGKVEGRYIGNAVHDVMCGLCAADLEPAAMDLFQNANSSWYDGNNDPYQTRSQLTKLLHIVVHADMRNLFELVFARALVLLDSVATAHKLVMFFCLIPSTPVTPDAFDYHWSKVPAAMQREFSHHILELCTQYDNHPLIDHVRTRI